MQLNSRLCINKFLVRLHGAYNILDEDPSLRIESSAIINLRDVSTKLNKYRLYIVRKNEAGIFYIFLHQRQMIFLTEFHGCFSPS